MSNNNFEPSDTFVPRILFKTLFASVYKNFTCNKQLMMAESVRINEPQNTFKHTVLVSLYNTCMSNFVNREFDSPIETSKTPNANKKNILDLDLVQLDKVSEETVKMWDINSGKCFQEFQTNSRVLSLTNSPASDLIVYGLEDGGLDLVTYKTQSNSHNVIKHSDCVLTTKFSPKGNYIISGAKGGMLTISGVDACFRQLASELLSNSVLSCDVVSSTDGDYISVGTWDNKISLYKLVGV
ncbi:predicted protein [Naegleria gruberi]|uniref:Predicted protein n=1 Tax=Naegleria gruberi TaxID=5762 RepID=D2W4M9_NAEGR|nr:uncharacterized protein NAEGRDRAFT_76363 [Naegleria gruberi]EFC35973.1 predicted protein [Naegleria gruberi]|eukprot:XP_002668717.1 predicted protein [Naegleria gruberi strain NEG-M]